MKSRIGNPGTCTLVTGGAGFIGSHVVESLLRRGTEVRVLDDLSTGRASHVPVHDPNLELRTGDVLDPGIVATAMRGVRACVHLAAQPRPRAGADPYEATLSNILGFLNVLEAARQARVQRVVYASSAAVYGDAQAPFSEATPPRPVTPQGIEKLVVEGYAELYRRRYGMKALGLRYFSVYGPRQPERAPGAGAIARFLERLEGRRPALVRGDGWQTRDYIHVDDAAQATVAALDSTCTGVCNVATGRATAVRELVRQIGYALDLQPLTHFVPARPGEVAACWADTRRLREDLGFIATRSLQAGLAALASDRAARERVQRPQIAPPRYVRPAAARAARSLS
jgi:UDP-glucose 4-epimerase